MSRIADQTPDCTAALRKGQDALLTEVDRIKRRLVRRVADECAGRGIRRIVLWGVGTQAAAISRQPWRQVGIEVVGVVGPGDADSALIDVPFLSFEGVLEVGAEAVVLATDSNEREAAREAERMFGPLGLPVLRVFGDPPDGAPRVLSADQLAAEFGVDAADAAWLIENRSERHDATLPMLPPERTELHLRRYEFACRFAEGLVVLDAACGTGYGSSMLARLGRARAVTGLDIDADAVGYASRRHGSGNVGFRVGDVSSTGLDSGSFDLVVSFETIEHVVDASSVIDEFARVLRPSGMLIMSTPNDWGQTEHHVHSFTRASFESLVAVGFEVVELWGQRVGDEPRRAGLPAGIYELTEGAPTPALFIVRGIARG